MRMNTHIHVGIDPPGFGDRNPAKILVWGREVSMKYYYNLSYTMYRDLRTLPKMVTIQK